MAFHLAHEGGIPAAGYLADVPANSRASSLPQMLHSLEDQHGFTARDAVNRLKGEFGHAVTVDVLLKNDSGGTRLYQENVQRVDDHIPENYDPASLLRMLKAHEGLK